MNLKLRVYVAGPISKGDLLHNIRQADNAFFALMRAGFAPMNPMLSCFAGSAEWEERWERVVAEAGALPCGTTHEDWMGIDLPWVAASHTVLRLPGESVGADKEVALAESLGIPVFHDVEKLIQTMGAERPRGTS